MRNWAREHVSLSTRELRQAAIFAFSNDTAMIHEAIAFLAQSERSNDLHIERSRASLAFREIAAGQRPARVLDFLAGWNETVDGQVWSLLEMRMNDLDFVIEHREEVDAGRLAHTSVLKSIRDEIRKENPGYSGLVGSFLKQNPATRSTVETIINDYRKDYA